MFSQRTPTLLRGMTLAGVAALTVATSSLHGLSVTRLSIMDAERDIPLGPLADGSTLALSMYPAISLRADTSGAVGSVVFSINGTRVQTESTPPYAIAGDSFGDFSPWQVPLGPVTITAVPYSNDGGAGTAGPAFSVTVEFVTDVVGSPYALTVVDGSGSGSFPGGYLIPIVGGTPPPGQIFDQWTATAGQVGDPGTERTTFLMPYADTTVTAGFTGDPIGSQLITITGERKRWHTVTLSMEGPFASETGEPNPFLDYRMMVNFQQGSRSYRIPAYFAADGNAANSSATSGNIWRAHFAPDRPGEWSYTVEFYEGDAAAVTAGSGSPLEPYHGIGGKFQITETDKVAPDFRARGRLVYDSHRYLRFQGDLSYFIKAGPDSPENLLGYEDFDGTYHHGGGSLKSWSPHVNDWNPGDPTWQNGKGKGLIGALNYIASEGQNVVSFLTYNSGGDGKDVWPHLSHNATPGEGRVRYDCSKLDQWNIVLAHAQELGIFLHFKLQERENDNESNWALDGGNVGTERRLYYREIIARFGHLLALEWNLGEENSQTDQQRKDMALALKNLDPFPRNRVIHTWPGEYDQIYGPMLGGQSELTGASLQTPWQNADSLTLEWIARSRDAGQPWVVASDEVGPGNTAVPPDNGYQGFSGGNPSQNDVREQVLWGHLMGGGAGVQLYFGYDLPQNDLDCEDWRSRNRMWDYNRHALRFFEEFIPFWMMEANNALVEQGEAMARPGVVYAVYLPNGGTTRLNLSGHPGEYEVQWFDPRNGGNLQTGTVQTINSNGSGWHSLGQAPHARNQDWAVRIRSTRLDIERWASTRPSVDLSNLEADIDGDNLNVIEEYARALEPNRADSVGSVSGNVTETEGVVFYRLNPDAEDITIIPEWTANFTGWSPEDFDVTLEEDFGEYLWMRAAHPISLGSRIFLRTRVELAP